MSNDYTQDFIDEVRGVLNAGVTNTERDIWNSKAEPVEVSSDTTSDIVTLDGLQGGVPFSEIAVSGKNLIPYPYNITSGVYNGVIVTVKNDGRFDVNGTPTKSFNLLSFAPNKYFLEGGKQYTFSCNKQYDVNTFNIYVRVYNEHGVVVRGISTYPTTITANDGDYFFWTLWANENYEISATDVEVQVELGDTATAYEPPITGRELTIHACGKNLIPYPYAHTTRTADGIAWTDNGDGSIIANGTSTAQTWFAIFSNAKFNGGTYTLSGNQTGGNLKYNTNFIWTDKNGGEHWVIDYGEGITFTLPYQVTAKLMFRVYNGITVENVTFRPQLEIGNTATTYEPYSGAQYTITPDSNPYTVPDDIRQQDGLNNISVSSGELSVTGIRENKVIKKIWDKFDELSTAIVVSNSEL